MESGAATAGSVARIRRYVRWEYAPHAYLLSLAALFVTRIAAVMAGAQVGNPVVVALTLAALAALLVTGLACFGTYYVESKRAGLPWIRYAVGHALLGPLAAFVWVLRR